MKQINKMCNRWVFGIIFLTGIFSHRTEGQTANRVKNVIYHSIDASNGFHPCFRRANGTHQFGCQTELGGNKGVVLLVTKENETHQMKWITEDGPHSPYMVILTPKTFTKENLDRLRSSGRVSGVLLLSANSYEGITDPPAQYSDDQSCPNQGASIYSSSSCSITKPWNAAGQNTLFENWPFPIVLLNNIDTISYLIDNCYKKFNVPIDTAKWPLCAIEIDANMLQAVDSETCLRRNDFFSISGQVKHCDKMGDLNVFMLQSPPLHSFLRHQTKILIHIE